MELDETHLAAVRLAGQVKGKMVDFATSPPFARHLRRLVRGAVERDPDLADPGMRAIERLLFEFRYDDGTTVVDRFIRQPGLNETERAMAHGFTQGVEGFFEVLIDTPPKATAFPVRCCLSDLEHVVVPTEPAGVPALAAGSFLAGRLNPVAGTGVWTPSGALEVVSASRREAVAEAVMQMALQAPWLTHRNPEKRRTAAEQTVRMHERFVERHGSDLIVVAGTDLATVYAEAVAPAEGRDPADVASAQSLARHTIEDSELAAADHVLMLSHPVAGFGFYQDFPRVARALEQGSGADPDDLEILRGYLDDEGVPSWLLRRVVEDRLPAGEAALALALDRPGFDWKRHGEQLLASIPGDHEPTLTLAIVPSMCSARE